MEVDLNGSPSRDGYRLGWCLVMTAHVLEPYTILACCQTCKAVVAGRIGGRLHIRSTARACIKVEDLANRCGIGRIVVFCVTTILNPDPSNDIAIFCFRYWSRIIRIVLGLRFRLRNVAEAWFGAIRGKAYAPTAGVVNFS